MFLIIPAAIFCVAILGIAVIVWRKMPYLSKLAPESHEMGSTIWHDFMPEVFGHANSIQWKEYWQKVLHEMEKFLRRIKLFFASIDRVSDNLIDNLRKMRKRQAAEQQTSAIQPMPATDQAGVEAKPKKQTNIWFMNMEMLRQEEQKLIVGIAQDPKNVSLYQMLGDVYMRLKNYEDAKESFVAALKIDPANQKLIDKLAVVEGKLLKDAPIQ